MRAIRIFALSMSLALSAAAGAGCKPALIPGTNVEDTDENRKVIEFLGKYRSAIVNRDTAQVMGLVTKDYFEDNGTPDQSDDYGAAQLRDKLAANFERTKEIQLDIVVQQIERPGGEKGPVRVVYRYSQRARVDFPAGEKWITVTEVNRLMLNTDSSGDYRISSGL